MEEATVLCDRLGIFVDGQLVCVGSPQELTSRYADFFVSRMACVPVFLFVWLGRLGGGMDGIVNRAVDLHWGLPVLKNFGTQQPDSKPGPVRFPGQVFTIMTPVEQAERAHALVLSISPSARLTYSVAGTRKYELPVTEVTLAGVFEHMLRATADQDLSVLDWGIANATLEEVFIKVGPWWGRLTGRTLARYERCREGLRVCDPSTPTALNPPASRLHPRHDPPRHTQFAKNLGLEGGK